MNEGKRSNNPHCHGEGKHKRGHSSFWMHDPKFVFSELDLKEGDYILDVGCGPGDYAIEAARMVGDSGMVYALDKQEEMINLLKMKVNFKGFKNINAMVSDITYTIPVEDHCVDVCLIITVLHYLLNVVKDGGMLFSEIRRVLKTNGRIAIIECKKEEQPFGPPKHMRLSPEEVSNIIMPYGFEQLKLSDLGYNYLVQYLTIPCPTFEDFVKSKNIP